MNDVFVKNSEGDIIYGEVWPALETVSSPSIEKI